MTIAGVAAAVILGMVIGVLGRLFAPGRPDMPAWLLILAGVVAAFAGTGLAQVLRLGDGGWSPWETVLQVVVAATGVCLVAALWPKRTGRRS
ncbi:GlsB/YeaQ/YmgE family stress response membrane protein [Actinomadura chokoriensis]|uniref:GlsB/YeaQ/YmgE family stress response membrane protein n=1 Tax=Actinomadura chokoriensis TaxID=454156 RepID=A0ABV4QY20_9ACTN